MSIQNSSLMRSSRKRIFESPINESLTQSRNLSTNTPNGNLEQQQYVKTSQFSLNTPVNSSIQEADFQIPAQSLFKLNNTPSFNKKNNNPIIRKELSKYLEDSGQLRIDEGQYDSAQSSEESVKSFQQQQNMSQRYTYLNRQVQSSKVQQQESNNIPNTVYQSEESQQSIKIPQQVEKPPSSNRINQELNNSSQVLSQKDIQIDQLEESQEINNENKAQIQDVQQSQIQQSLKSNQSDWEFNQLDQLIKGFLVIKFCRKEFFGKKKRLFQITPDLKLIIFRNTDHKITKIYSINKIRKIEKGANTETFKQYKLKPALQCFCFSIYLDERTVDISFETQESLEYALDCLNGLIQNK